jgi:TetR/AcrR family transcriptional repressor of nem operon
LIAAGAQLLGKRAYGALGVAEICAVAGVPKGSFYYFFPSKQDFALAVIDEHWDQQRAQWAEILSAAAPIGERLHELFRATAKVQQDALEGTGSVAGCMFGNLALELSSSEPEVNERLREIFDAQVEMVQTALGGEHSRFAGSAGIDLGGLASSVVANLEGVVLLAKLHNDPARVEANWTVTARMLGLEPAAA